ncbi:MAG: serine/threonine protein kinase [Deltaproteobacteria bacterium]|nr:serine/threonine protein kinase [Deltaproteobacteria bacterium]
MSELEGKILDGKYRLTRRLGSGGVGTVYEAVHAVIGQKFAVKILKPEYATSPTLALRLVQEAKAASAIDHPSIIKVFDAGRTKDGLTFLVMELLVGQELSARIRGTPEPMSPDEAVDITSDVLDALVAAHKKGIIHRDLKPENVFLTRGPHGQRWIKLLDFGIAKVVDQRMAGPRLTHAGTVVGTPFYMAPEHARGARDLDVRVDVYAAGVMLFEMLTRRVPFDGQSYNEVLAKVLSEPFPRPRKFNPGIPEGLEAVMLRATAKDRNARFPTASAFLEALGPFVPEAPSAVFRLQEAAAFERERSVGTADLEMVPEESIPTISADIPAPDTRPAPDRPVARVHPPGSPEPAPAPAPAGEPQPEVAAAFTVRLSDEPEDSIEAPRAEQERGTLTGAIVPAPERAHPRLALWISAGVVVAAVAVTLIWSAVGGGSVPQPSAPPSPPPDAAATASIADAAPADGPPSVEATAADEAADAGPSVAALADASIVEAVEPVETATAAVSDAAPPDGGAAQVTIRVLGVPAEAKIWVDGLPAVNPFEIEPSDAAHRLKVTAPGFQPFSTTFSASESMGIAVRLLRARDTGPADAGEARDTRAGQLLPDPHLPH